MGRSASVGGWVHQWVARWLGCESPSHSMVLSLLVTSCRRHTDQHFLFFFSCCGLWCGGGCGCVGRLALVGGWVRRHQWVAQVGFVVVGVGVAADQPQTHTADWTTCLLIGWVSGDFLFCLV